jgi:hypothetical protein
MALLAALEFVVTRGSSQLTLAILIAWLLLMAFVFEWGTRMGIEIADDGRQATVIPSWFARRYFRRGETVIQLPAGSELLFCRRIRFCIAARTPDGAEHLLIEEERGLSRKQCQQLAEELKRRFGLRVLLLKQRIPGRGPDEEWTPEFDRAIRKTRLRNVPLAMAFGLLPWSGAAARLLTPDAKTVAFIGFVLWALGCLWFWYLRGRQDRRGPGISAHLFLWTIMFGTFFTAATLATDAFLRR